MLFSEQQLNQRAAQGSEVPLRAIAAGKVRNNRRRRDRDDCGTMLTQGDKRTTAGVRYGPRFQNSVYAQSRYKTSGTLKPRHHRWNLIAAPYNCPQRQASSLNTSWQRLNCSTNITMTGADMEFHSPVKNGLPKSSVVRSQSGSHML